MTAGARRAPYHTAGRSSPTQTSSAPTSCPEHCWPSAMHRSSPAALICFQTAAELRRGALRRGWREARMPRLEAKIQRAEIVRTGPELVLVYAQLRDIPNLALESLAS